MVLGVSKRFGNEREARRADLLNIGCDAFLPVPPSWTISTQGHSLHGPDRTTRASPEAAAVAIANTGAATTVPAATHMVGYIHEGGDMDPYHYDREAIARSAYAILRAPDVLLEDELEDLLFLAAAALKLEHIVSRRVGHIGWVSSHQQLILEWRDSHYSFSEVCARAGNLALAQTWLEEFMAGVCPGEENPRATSMSEYIVELEELSLSRQSDIPVAFAVQAFLLTEPEPDVRRAMLAALALAD